MSFYGIIDLILILVSALIGVLAGARFSERIESLMPFFDWGREKNNPNKDYPISKKDIEKRKDDTEIGLKQADIITNEDFEIDVHLLNRVHPQKAFTTKAKFKHVGRRKAMKYDFSDFEEEINTNEF